MIPTDDCMSLSQLVGGQGTQGVPRRQHHGLHLHHGQHRGGDQALVHHNLEHKLFEPVGSHHEVSLLPSVLPPGVLHPPPHDLLVLHVTPGQHHGVSHQRVPVEESVGLVQSSLHVDPEDQL